MQVVLIFIVAVLLGQPGSADASVAPDPEPAVFAVDFAKGIVSVAAGDPLKYRGFFAPGFQISNVVVSPDQRYLLVAESRGSTVLAFDTQKLGEPRAVQTGRWPSQLTFSPDGKELWLVNHEDGALEVRSGAPDWSPQAKIAIGKQPSKPLFNRKGDRVFVASENGLAIVDTVERKVLKVARTKRGTHSMVLSPDEKWLYLTNYLIKTLYVVNTATGEVSTDLDVPNGTHYLALSANGSTLFIASDTESPTISVVDTGKRSVTASIAVGQRPMGMAFSRDHGKLYVLASREAAVYVIDVAKLTVIDKIPLKGQSYELKSWPTRDLIAVTGAQPDGITLISTLTDKVAAELATQAGAGSFVFGVLPQGAMLQPPGSPLPGRPAGAFARPLPTPASRPAGASTNVRPLEPISVVWPGTVPANPKSRGELVSTLPPIALVDYGQLTASERQRTSPTLVTIQQRYGAREFVDELSRQTGFKFVASSGVQSPLVGEVQLVVKDYPWLAVMHSLNLQPGLHMRMVDDQTVLFWNDSHALLGNQAKVASGPFLLGAGAVRRDAAPKGAPERFSLSLSIDAEAKIWGLGMARYPSSLDLEDENGKRFTDRTSKAAAHELGFALIQFERPADVGTKLARVRGVAHALVAINSESAVFAAADIPSTRARTIKVGGLEMELKAAIEKAKGRSFDEFRDVSLTVQRNGQDEKEWAKMKQWLRHVRVRGFEASGRRMLDEDQGLADRTLSCSRTVRVASVIAGTDRQAELQSISVEVPTKLAELDVPFVFKDLTLPQ